MVHHADKEINMPTIVIRPIVGDHDDPHETTTGLTRTLALRIKVAVKGDALLRELAAGAPPALSPELALRASKLVNDRLRRHLARALRRAIRDAHQPVTTRSRISIVDREAVIDAEVAIEALIARLSSRQRVATHGVAMVERLITDGVASPLYNRARPGTLRRQVLAATIALELEPERDEFPLAA
jgi:hypothetical protein